MCISCWSTKGNGKLSTSKRSRWWKVALLGKTSTDQHMLCFGAGMLVTSFISNFRLFWLAIMMRLNQHQTSMEIMLCAIFFISLIDQLVIRLHWALITTHWVEPGVVGPRWYVTDTSEVDICTKCGISCSDYLRFVAACHTGRCDCFEIFSLPLFTWWLIISSRGDKLLLCFNVCIMSNVSMLSVKLPPAEHLIVSTLACWL